MNKHLNAMLDRRRPAASAPAAAAIVDLADVDIDSQVATTEPDEKPASPRRGGLSPRSVLARLLGTPRRRIATGLILVAVVWALHSHVIAREKCTGACKGELACCYEKWFAAEVLCTFAKYFGCRRWTPACVRGCDFLPEGRLMNRPCCVEAIRTTMKYVLRKLEDANVTYMIDRGVVLSSLRLGDIHPWDDDGDVVIFADPDRQISRFASTDEAERAIFEIFGTGGVGSAAFGTNAEGFYFRGDDILHSGINRFYVDFFYHTYVGVDMQGKQVANVPVNRTHLHCTRNCNPRHTTALPYPVQNVLPLGKCLLFQQFVSCAGKPVEYVLDVFRTTPAELLIPRYAQANEAACLPDDPYCGRDLEADKKWIRETTCRVASAGAPSLCEIVSPKIDRRPTS
jgi:hypothetical protein